MLLHLRDSFIPFECELFPKLRSLGFGADLQSTLAQPRDWWRNCDASHLQAMRYIYHKLSSAGWGLADTEIRLVVFPRNVRHRRGCRHRATMINILGLSLEPQRSANAFSKSSILIHAENSLFSVT